MRRAATRSRGASRSPGRSTPRATRARTRRSSSTSRVASSRAPVRIRWWSTPPGALGAVAGIAREVLLERVPELEERIVSLRELSRAAEIVAVNAVRGARAVVALDGRPVGAGVPGPASRRLDAELARGEEADRGSADSEGAQSKTG